MDSSTWQEAWATFYENYSDERWKTKSLNPSGSEQYTVPMCKPAPKPAQVKQSGSKKDKQPQKEKDNRERLPQPKMSKINKSMFCISLETEIHLFYLTSEAEGSKVKNQKQFGIVSHPINQRIEFVKGNNSRLIFVGTKSSLIVLEIVQNQEGKYQIQHKTTKQIPQLRTIINLGSRIIALSSSHILEFEVADQLREVSVTKIQFSRKEDEDNFSSLNPVGIVIGSGHSIFYFGSKVDQKIDNRKIKGAPGQNPTKQKCEGLTVVKLKIEGTGKVQNARASLYPVDHIFQFDIFTRSKIYEIEKQIFLVSLHEEVILIRQNFDSYIVWDNVSVVSSKSQSKKGQLVLADKKILVFSQNKEIFAHEIFFDDKNSKMSLPPIDSFKGNQEEEEVLYDALMLEDKGSVVKVLAYIKPTLVVYPTNENNFRRDSDSKSKDTAGDLVFTVICIKQSDPKEKLEQLIRSGKSNQDIDTFCTRFGISKLEKTKCSWNVSSKQLKDIENILMDITDDTYIQTQLDNILKSESHDLNFLNAVEVKQITRLRNLLVTRVIQFASNQLDEHKQPEYIEDIIKWYMESIMFKEKISYSKQFLSFKEYDFIQIGKLKAASLKEEIKLLSCKKYEKRLTYFLNSFKVLVISNYEQVFKFLLIDKNERQIEDFIREFRFILPNFDEVSQVFIKQRDFGIFERKKTPRVEVSGINSNSKRQRYLSFAQTNNDFIVPAARKDKSKGKEKEKEKQKEKQKQEKESDLKQNEDKCLLWEPLDQSKQINETMEVFESEIIKEIEKKIALEGPRAKAVNKFRQILANFQKKPWFQTAAFKQHSMITKTTKQILDEFKQLKRKGAFKILIRFLYAKILQAGRTEKALGSQMEERVNIMLQNFIDAGFIPQSFKRNVDARVLVYRNLLQKKNAAESKKVMMLQLLPLGQFVTQGEPQYFDFLFRNIRNKILTSVKDIYDSIAVGFFRERFQLFLQSSLITPDDIISFLDEFTEDIVADDIRIDVFCTIKRLLRLSDKVNTKCYIEKCMDMEVLPERDVIQSGKLREEAKIPYGYYFYHFFKVFKLDYTYEEFINFTSTLIKDNKIIQQIVGRYCRGEYTLTEDHNQNPVCQVQFEEVGIHQKIEDVDIHNQPLEFFGLLLHLLDVMDFEIEEKDVFELIMENYLNEHKFTELSEFIRKLREYHVTEYNLHTKNYQMISDFKEEIDVDDCFVVYVLEWVKRNYNSIKSVEDLNDRLESVSQALTTIQRFNKNMTTIRKQKSLFDLLTYMKWFEPGLILNVEEIKEEAKRYSSFIFLMHIFKKIGVEKLSSSDQNYQNQAVKVQNLFRIFESHKEHTQLQKVDFSHPQFIRFLIQLCISMIENNHFRMAKFLLLEKIPNDKYYFKDVMLLFLASAEREDSRGKEYRDDIIKQILMPQTTSLIRTHLQTIIQKYKIQGFIGSSRRKPKAEIMLLEAFQKTQPKIQSKSQARFGEQIKNVQSKEHNNEFIARCREMFEMLMSKHRKDDAFFFLVRVKSVPNTLVIETVRRFRSQVGDEQDRIRQSIQNQSYLLVVAYLKALQAFIEKEFYPSYSFYESKLNILMDPKERKDMIKDINIAVSKLQRYDAKTQASKAKLEATRIQLQSEYKQYMAQIGQEADIKLVDEEGASLPSRKVQIYTRKVTRELFQEEANQEIEYKKDLQKNIEKVNQVQEDNRLNVLNRQVTERITEIKKANERHALLEAETKKEVRQPSLAERKAKEIEEVKRKEREEIQSIKDTYQSNTTKRVNELIESLRKKRETVQAMRVAPTSSVRDEGRQSSASIKTPLINVIQPPSARTLQSPKSQSVSEHLLPITMKAKAENRLESREEVTENKSQFVQLQKKMFPETPFDPSLLKKKANFEDIAKLYKEQQSVQALKHIQKYDMLKNPQVRTELVKRAYSVTNNLANFLEFAKFLIASDPSWKESIEQKSLTIANQMIKMKEKEKVNIKEIIPPEFFTSISKVNIKDYYGIAYEILKPNLKKIFEKQLMPVHAIGILFRYSLGSENKFYGKVMYEYFKVLIKNYQLKTYDDKQLTTLAEKLRSNYASLPDSKDQVFQQLISSVSNSAKKARLLEVLKRIVERGGQSLVGGQSNKELTAILHRIMK